MSEIRQEKSNGEGAKCVELIVAVRNEEQNIPRFVDAVNKLTLPPGVTAKILFIEDSSTDQTRPILRELAKAENVNFLFMKRGYGQALALALGLARSKADAAVMMDVDGGHPVEVIPEMASRFLSGADAVQGVRRTITSRRKFRDWGTYLFNRCFFLLTGVKTEKQNVYFRLLSRTRIESLLRNNRWKHFLRIDYTFWPKEKVQYVEFDAAERIFGTSQYNFKRLMKFAVTAVLSSISSARFAACMVLAAAIAAILWYTIHPLVILLVIVPAGLIAAEFYQMSMRDPLEIMAIEEASR